MNQFQVIHLIISALLILLLGILSGYSLGFYRGIQGNFEALAVSGELNPKVSTLKLLEVSNGKLRGLIEGRKTRIAYRSDQILSLKPQEYFEIPLESVDLKSYYLTQNTPEEAQFLASASGKYYYSIFDKQAYRISPANRIYFKSETEAQKQGYQKRD